MDSFLLNGRAIEWEQLDQAVPLTSFESDTLRFLQAWKNGDHTFYIHTSGSTGTPRPIEIDREQMSQSARRTIRYLNLDHRDHAFVCMNTAFIAGKMMLVRALEADMRLTVADPSSTPFRHMPAKPTFTALVPLQLEHAFTEHAGTLRSFKVILVGGAPVSSALLERTARESVPVFETYGMTETLTHIALKKISGPVPENHFTVLPGIEIKQTADHCLEIRGDVTRNQWITTSDQVTLRGTNGFVWLGRKDFVINSGGVKVHPEQVEARIQTFFRDKGITNQFLIVPLPDERLGQVVTLVMEGVSGLSGEKILEKLRYILDPYARPRLVRHLPHFPTTPTGKTDRREVIRRLNA